MKKIIGITFFTIGFFILNSCSISYKLEGGSINYDFTKTIRIVSFPNRTPFYPELTQVFDLALRKRFIEQTRLKEVDNNGDIEIEGEITNYSLSGTAVKDDAYASRTRLTISVKVEYINNKEAGKDVSQTFSAFQEFDNTVDISSQEDEFVRLIVEDLVDQIYNATVANW